MKLKLFLFFLCLSTCQGGKIRLLADGPVERCDKKPAKDLIYAINLEFLTENDEAYVNGNGTFGADVDVWNLSFWTEKKSGSSWFRAPIQGSNIDVCKNLVDEKEFLYPFLKGLQGCPFKKGDALLFDMKKFEFDDFEVPEKLEGEYTLYVEFVYLIKGVFYKECWKKRGEVSHY